MRSQTFKSSSAAAAIRSHNCTSYTAFHLLSFGMCGIVPYLFRARYLATSSDKGLLSRAAIAGERTRPLPLTIARAAIMRSRARIIGLKAGGCATQPGAAKPHPARSRRAGIRQDLDRQTGLKCGAWAHSTGQRANDRPTEGTCGRGAPPRPREGGRERAENERRAPGAARQAPDATPATEREQLVGASQAPTTRELY